MQGVARIVLIITGLCAVICAETVDIFSLCGNGLIPDRYVTRTEKLVLQMSGSQWRSKLFCKVRIAGNSAATMYYSFTRFSVNDFSTSVEMSRRADYGITEKDTYTSIDTPILDKHIKAYQTIVITLRRDSILDKGLSASVTIYIGGGSFLSGLPVSSIVGIVIGGIATIIIIIGVTRYCKMRNRGNRAGVVRATATTYPTTVTYSNTATPNAYPMHTHNQPTAYHIQGMTPGYLPPSASYGYQPGGVAPWYPPPPGQPPPSGQPPAYEAPKPSAPYL